jgi:RHS repeat-associated protein
VLPIPIPHGNDGRSVRNYRRTYAYDDGNNLVSVTHRAAGNPSVREMPVSEIDNRLAGIPHDAHGNQLRLGDIRLAWDHRNHLAHATLMERADGRHDREHYAYDAALVRVRKTTDRYGSGGEALRTEETLYLGGLELRRTWAGGRLVAERRSLVVRAGDDVLAVVDTFPVGGEGGARVRLQLVDHLGSSGMEVDERGHIISYEVYYPYGGTALIAGNNAVEVQRKLYRYSSKERDAATGLYYYGARYHAPWLGRWTSPDPAGTVDGLNLYAFVGGGPAGRRDRFGLVWQATAGGRYGIDSDEPNVVWARSNADPPRFTEQIPDRERVENDERYVAYQIRQELSDIHTQDPDCLGAAEHIMNLRATNDEVASKVKYVNMAFGNKLDTGNPKVDAACEDVLNIYAAQEARLKGLGIEDNADPVLGEAYAIVRLVPIDDHPPYHVEAVVAIDGESRITYSVSAPVPDVDVEGPHFAMYGSGANSFHSQMTNDPLYNTNCITITLQAANAMDISSSSTTTQVDDETSSSRRDSVKRGAIQEQEQKSNKRYKR